MTIARSLFRPCDVAVALAVALLGAAVAFAAKACAAGSLVAPRNEIRGADLAGCGRRRRQLLRRRRGARGHGPADRR